MKLKNTLITQCKDGGFVRLFMVVSVVWGVGLVILLNANLISITTCTLNVWLSIMAMNIVLRIHLTEIDILNKHSLICVALSSSWICNNLLFMVCTVIFFVFRNYLVKFNFYQTVIITVIAVILIDQLSELISMIFTNIVFEDDESEDDVL